MGMDLSGRALAAQAGPAEAAKAADPKDPNWSDWEFYSTNVYDAEDTKILKQFQG
jgi:hypothetical protein